MGNGWHMYCNSATEKQMLREISCAEKWGGNYIHTWAVSWCEICRNYVVDNVGALLFYIKAAEA